MGLEQEPTQNTAHSSEDLQVADAELKAISSSLCHSVRGKVWPVGHGSAETPVLEELSLYLYGPYEDEGKEEVIH